MKYLYVRLDKIRIITFKSVSLETFEGQYRMVFNNTLGDFIVVHDIETCIKISDLIEEYLGSDEPSKRILDLCKFNLWEEIMKK